MRTVGFVALLISGILFYGCEDTAMVPQDLSSAQAKKVETSTPAASSPTTTTTNPVSTSTPVETKPQTSTQTTSTPASTTASTNPSASTPANTTGTSAPENKPSTSAPTAFTPQKEGQTAQNLQRALPSIKQYLAYVPEGYNARQDVKWPVVVFLHGSSEIGNDINSIFWTYFAWRTMDKKYPYILITPQLLNGNGSWSAADLDKMLYEVLPKYNADPSRIILTGYSLGAHGAWDWAELNPNRFAGLVPVAGWGDKSKAATLKNLPVWAFHGDADNVVSVNGSVEMINAIKASGGEKTKLTIYPGRGHDVHATTYDNPDVITWMLNQKR